MIIKNILLLFCVIFLVILAGCDGSAANDNPTNVQTNQENIKVSLSKQSVQNNELFDVTVNYKIDNDHLLRIRVFMEDSIYNYTVNSRFTSRCFVYTDANINLNHLNTCTTKTLQASVNFTGRVGENYCDCFPTGTDNRTYKIYTEVLNTNLIDSAIIAVGQNKYKVDYYYVYSGYPSINYDLLTKSDQNYNHWFKINDLFSTKLITQLKYPNYYTGQIVYSTQNPNINAITNMETLYSYLNLRGVSMTNLIGNYVKDKDVLLGFETILFGAIDTDPDTYGVTWQRIQRNDNLDGYAAISLIAFPKLETYLTSRNYSADQKDMYRRSLVAHELGHGRSSNCFNHPQLSSTNLDEKNCIMNENIGINDNVVFGPEYRICKYHKLLIQRRFWYPLNLNF